MKSNVQINNKHFIRNMINVNNNNVDIQFIQLLHIVEKMIP